MRPHAPVLTAMALALVVTASLAAQSPTAQDLVDYLNTAFGQRVWPHAQDTIKNFVIHETFKQVEAQGAKLALNVTTLDMSSPPGFTLDPATGGIVARFPASGHYRLTTYVDGGIIGSGLTVDMALEVDVGTSGMPKVRPQVTVSLSDIIVDAFVSEEEIADQVRTNLAGQLGFLGTLIFNPTVLRFGTPDVELIYGEPELDAEGALDIFLIADGFTSTDIVDFHAQAAVLAQKLTRADPTNHVSEPYASFRSAVRVWKLNAQSASGSDATQRVVTTYQDSITRSRKTGFSNLARLAQLGLRAQALGADVQVFVSSIRVAGFRGSTYDANARASAFGDLVLLPLNSDSAATATILVHELGHTVLGGLADEYTEDLRASDDYHGLEPAGPNVSILPGLKWLYWLSAPRFAAWDAGIGSFEGGYYVGSGIYRPAEHCKMRESREEFPFCQVCREAITRGIRSLLPENTALVETRYTVPFTKTAREYVRSTAGSASRTLDAFGPGPTTVRLRLLASSLPEPWTATWRRYRPGATIHTEMRTGLDHTFTVSFGDRIDLTIASGCRFAPRDPIASYTVSFHFSRAVTPTQGDPPTELQQSVSTGANVPVTYDPVTGAARLSLALSCRAGGYPGWTLPSTVQVNISGPVSRIYNSASPLARGTPVSFNVGVLPTGFYTWSARTLYVTTPVSSAVSLPTAQRFYVDATGRIRSQRCHFYVEAPSFNPTPAAPAAPSGLGSAITVSPTGGRLVRWITLSARSLDTNGSRLRLEFEVKPQGQAFDGQGLVQTGWLSPTLESLLVQGNVVVGPYLDFRVFRVRAVDETGRASAWVNGWLITSL